MATKKKVEKKAETKKEKPKKKSNAYYINGKYHE